MCGSIGYNTSAMGLGGSSGMGLLANTLGSVTQSISGSLNNKAQIEAGKRQADDTYKRLVANAIYEMNEAELAQQQANEASTQSKSEIAREMMRAREETKAAASAAGLNGNSLSRLLTDISFTEQQKKAVTDSNRDNIVHTQQLQKQKAIASTEMSPFYYNEQNMGAGLFNSMLGVVPALFSGFNFSSNCASKKTTTTTCGR